MKVFLTALLLAVTLLSCDAGRTPQYQGGLYFGQGAYLMRFSLNDGSFAVTGHLGDTSIQEVSAFGEDHLLIAELASVNRRPVSRISWFKLKTGESADLYSGVVAIYMVSARSIIYDDGTDLFAVPQIDDSQNQVIFSHEKNQLTRLVEVSSGILLFEVNEADQAAIYAWDSLTGDLSRLDMLAAACRLRGAVWIESLERLACKVRDVPFGEADYVLSDLNGTTSGALALDPEKEFLALTWIGSQNALVLRETWQSMLGERDKYAVWIYDLGSGESHRLAENVNLGESAVFTEF